jgi:aminoglycoside phosphotransferase family enzyme
MRKLIDALAETFAAFHSGLPGATPESRFGRPADIRHNALDNFGAIDELANGDAGHESAIRRLKAWTIAEADRLEQTFAQRRTDGFIRECHGDLHLRKHRRN